MSLSSAFFLTGCENDPAPQAEVMMGILYRKDNIFNSNFYEKLHGITGEFLNKITNAYIRYPLQRGLQMNETDVQYDMRSTYDYEMVFDLHPGITRDSDCLKPAEYLYEMMVLANCFTYSEKYECVVFTKYKPGFNIEEFVTKEAETGKTKAVSSFRDITDYTNSENIVNPGEEIKEGSILKVNDWKDEVKHYTYMFFGPTVGKYIPSDYARAYDISSRLKAFDFVASIFNTNYFYNENNFSQAKIKELAQTKQEFVYYSELRKQFTYHVNTVKDSLTEEDFPGNTTALTMYIEKFKNAPSPIVSKTGGDEVDSNGMKYATFYYDVMSMFAKGILIGDKPVENLKTISQRLYDSYIDHDNKAFLDEGSKFLHSINIKMEQIDDFKNIILNEFVGQSNIEEAERTDLEGFINQVMIRVVEFLNSSQKENISHGANFTGIERMNFKSSYGISWINCKNLRMYSNEDDFKEDPEDVSGADEEVEDTSKPLNLQDIMFQGTISSIIIKTLNSKFKFQRLEFDFLLGVDAEDREERKKLYKEILDMYDFTIRISKCEVDPEKISEDSNATKHNVEETYLLDPNLVSRDALANGHFSLMLKEPVTIPASIDDYTLGGKIKGRSNYYGYSQNTSNILGQGAFYFGHAKGRWKDPGKTYMQKENFVEIVFGPKMEALAQPFAIGRIKL